MSLITRHNTDACPLPGTKSSLADGPLFTCRVQRLWRDIEAQVGNIDDSSIDQIHNVFIYAAYAR